MELILFLWRRQDFTQHSGLDVAEYLGVFTLSLSARGPANRSRY